MIAYLNHVDIWISQLRDWTASTMGLVALLSCLLGYMAYKHYANQEHPTYDDEDYEKEGHVKLPAPLRNLKLTRKELKTYDSRNPNGAFLVGFLNKLYDVSCSPTEFGPNGIYKELTGTDIMWYIQKTKTYEPRGFDVYVEECEKKLDDHFYVAGVLLEEQEKVETTVGEYSTENDVVKEKQLEKQAEKIEIEAELTEKQVETVDVEEKLQKKQAEKIEFEKTLLEKQAEKIEVEEKLPETQAEKVEVDEKLQEEQTVTVEEDIEDPLEETLIWTKADETILAQ